MGDAGAIAVWCVPKEQAEASDFEVHFNYWRLATSDAGPSKVDRTDFLDIGIQLNDPAKIDRVSIYLPFSPSSVEDLGPKFQEPRIAEGIFNQLLNMLRQHNSKWTDFAQDGQPHHIRVFCFDKDLDGELSEEEKEGGVVLTISAQVLLTIQENLSPGCAAYFRLRAYMPIGRENVFIRVIRPPDTLLQSGYEELEFIDFRVNDPRSLPDKVERQVRDEAGKLPPRIKKIAFLIAVPTASDMTMSHAEVHRIRRLETSVWDKYVPDGIPPEMIVYHWRQVDKPEDPLKDFSAFVKLRTRRSGRGILAPYLIFAFALGVVGNLIASLLQFVGQALLDHLPR